MRFACIGAPAKSQAYGIESREALQGLLPLESAVTIKTRAVDRYGRSVAEVLKGGATINQILVGSG